MMWAGFIWLRMETVAGSYGHGSKLSTSLEDEKCLY
jgi:hypothetical protein